MAAFAGHAQIFTLRGESVVIDNDDDDESWLSSSTRSYPLLPGAVTGHVVSGRREEKNPPWSRV